VGGGYRIANQRPDGSLIWIAGEFLVVEPPHRLVFTWQLEPGGARPSRSRSASSRAGPTPRSSCSTSASPARGPARSTAGAGAAAWTGWRPTSDGASASQRAAHHQHVGAVGVAEEIEAEIALGAGLVAEVGPAGGAGVESAGAQPVAGVLAQHLIE